MKDYPFIREIRSPVTNDQLVPLDPRCRVVQFSEVLSQSDVLKLAEFMEGYPHHPLRMYGHYGKTCGLEFLKAFPFLRQFQVDAYELTDFSGLCFLPPELEYLGIGQTRSKTLSLRCLERFPSLRELSIESHTKDIGVLAQLNNLETLTLRSITLPDLDILLPLRKLLSLSIKLGGTKELGLLPEIGKIRYLELWLIKGMCDLSSLGRMKHLQYLFLQALKNVTALPSFKDLGMLRRVHLETMKGLRELMPLADAPVLEDLVLCDMGHLQPDELRPFLGHPSLRRTTIGLGSNRKNVAAMALLGLPPAGYKFDEGFVFRE